jgi:hypothetical protein
VGVTVGGVACPVASVTPAAVVCELAAESRTGPVVLSLSNAGSVTSRAPFRVIAPPAAPAAR